MKPEKEKLHNKNEVTWPFERSQIPQVRMSLNFKCGKACFYCRPFGESPSIHNDSESKFLGYREMTLAEIVSVAKVLVDAGVTDIKLTGGDPILRSDIVDIVRELKKIENLKSLHLITRHQKAGDIAVQLKEAGLDLLNFSLDSLNENVWKSITRVEGHKELMSAIRNSAKIGIPLKINTVVLKGVNNEEIPDLINFAAEIGAEIKFLDLINDMDGFNGFDLDTYYYDLRELVERLIKEGNEVEYITQSGGLGHPMPRFKMHNGAIVTVKSAKYGAYYGSICSNCKFFPCWDALMALRVTPNGWLQFCLLRSDNYIDILKLIQAGNLPNVHKIVNDALSVFKTAKPLTWEAISQIRDQNVENIMVKKLLNSNI